MSDAKLARSVELAHAFEWTCDDCGRVNFEHCISIGGSSVEVEGIEGLPAWLAESLWDSIEHGGVFIMAPHRVTCRHCGSAFATTDPLDPMPEIA